MSYAATGEVSLDPEDYPEFNVGQGWGPLPTDGFGTVDPTAPASVQACQQQVDLCRAAIPAFGPGFQTGDVSAIRKARQDSIVCQATLDACQKADPAYPGYVAQQQSTMQVSAHKSATEAWLKIGGIVAAVGAGGYVGAKIFGSNHPGRWAVGMSLGTAGFFFAALAGGMRDQ